MKPRRPPAGTSGRRLERVALVVNRLSLGGSEKQVVLLATALHDLGIHVAVGTLLEGGPRERDLREAGIKVHTFHFPPLDGGFPSPTAVVSGFARFVDWLHRERPQVVHAFLYHSYVLTPPAARLARVPVVVAGRRSLGHFKETRRAALAVEKVATRMTDLVIANSHAVAADVIRQERLPVGKIVVVHNALPPQAFLSSPPMEISTALPVVACIANLLPYKGHIHLLRAAALLAQQGLAITLLLVGDGPARVPLEAQAARTGLDIRFLGTRTDVASVYARADVAVLASLEEGLSNAVLEAMAAGKPIVATDVGGNREAIGGAGVLVPPASPEALAAALERLLRDPAERARLGSAARDRATSLFTLAGMVERHLELYETLVRSRCAGLPAT